MRCMPFAGSLGISFLALLAVAVPSGAATPPALKLDDGMGDVVTLDSTGVVTFSPGCSCSTTTSSVAPGSVTWTGTIGPFSAYSVNGRTKPALGAPDIDLGVQAITTAGTGGTLTISWTDTGFSPGAGPAAMNETTSVFSGTAKAIYKGYVDNTDTAFGSGITVGTIGPTSSGGLVTGPGPTMDPFSMTQVEAITMSANAVFVNDFSLMTAPNPPLTLTCPVASGQVGVSYTSGLVANGGISPYHFSIIAGSLPSGLVLDPSAGAITGTPGVATSYNFTAQVTDSSSPPNVVTTSCGIAIAPPPPPPVTLSCSGSTGQVGVPYSSSLVAMGGKSPYAFSIVSGSLPTNLFLNAGTGAIAGTPTTAGSFTFTAQAVDSTGTSADTATANCTISITQPPITSSCVTINATAGTAIAPLTLSASGGAGGPYTFTATGLPAGLSISSSGTISGTPTVSGTFPYTVTITDKNGNTGTLNCSVTVTSYACTIPPAGTAIGGSAVSWNKFSPKGSNNVVWIHAHIGTPSGVSTTTTTTVNFTGVSFVLNGHTYALPDGQLVFNPAASVTPTTTFDGARWTTTLNPSKLSDEIFFDGNAIAVDSNITSGGSAVFSYTTNSTDPNLAFSWQWSAAVYTYWPGNNQAQILPYHLSDHAGTPENKTVQQSLIQGPRGGGGSNYTGSWSGTGQGTCSAH